MDTSANRNYGGLIVAIMVLTTGGLLLADVFLPSVSVWADYWWVYFFALAGTFALVLPGQPRFVVAGVIVLIGVFFVLNAYLSLDLVRFLFPAVIISVGLLLLYFALMKSKSATDFVIFGSYRNEITAPITDGSPIMAAPIFGSLDLVIEETAFQSDVTLQTFVLFGECKVRVSTSVNVVKRDLLTLFGETRSRVVGRPGGKTLTVTGLVLFGDMQIRN